MSLLDRKLLRDMLAMRGQITTIALLVATGVAVLAASVSTYDTLLSTRTRFYEFGRFADAFATVKRAPNAAAARLAEIPGVSAVETRIVREVIVDWPSTPLPVSARLVSIANGGEEALNRLHLRQGVAPGPGETRAALINEAFAEANGVAPGADIHVILNGRRETFRVSGVALSPEYVYATKPGLMIPDDRYYAILWVDRATAEGAFDMKGAFNDAVFRLAPDANGAAVIEAIDDALEPYGGTGAVGRRDQPSHRFLDDELTQQKVMAFTIPIIFFGVAAFLLNIALGRLVVAQREQIAALKALGFSSGPIVAHYLKLVVAIVALGALLGALGGQGFGALMILSYRGFFRFPEIVFELTPWSIVAGTGVSFIAAALGVVTSLRRIAALAPAVAMRPAAPIDFRRATLERLFPAAALTPRRAMVARNIAGRPVRALMTIIGIAFAVPMVVLALFWRDAINTMVDVQFGFVERGNVAVSFPRPLDAAVLRDLAREPGVLVVEGQRHVPARLRAGHRSYLTAVIGLTAGAELRSPRDKALNPVEATAGGVTLTRFLAERLGVSPGGALTVEVMEGRREKRDVVVAATVDEMLGMNAYMDIAALNQLTGEGDIVSAASLHVDPARTRELGARFKQLPVIASVSMKANAVSAFLDKVAGLVLVSAAILTGFAVIIAVGVVFNSARIALQERAWELASLRVLGFTRTEVSSILFAEFAIELAQAIPLGLWLSLSIVDLIIRLHANETFQIPATIGAATLASAALVVVAAALASAWAVRRRIDRLDLVAALKTRE